MHGVLTVRLHISASGSLDRISPLANTLVSLEGRAGAAGEAVALALDVCQTARFVDCPGPGTLLLPFIAADR
jgi:hypothetical protein